MRRLAALTLAAALAGCATVAPPEPLPAQRLSGRLALKIDATPQAPARSLSAVFDLAGNADNGQLELSTPLGTMIARARWTAQSAALTTAQGETRHADLPTLTRDMLGEAIPVQAMFDWLRGRPWPGAPSTEASATGFRQLGWAVDASKLDESALLATREAPPAVTVRVKLDRP